MLSLTPGLRIGEAGVSADNAGHGVAKPFARRLATRQVRHPGGHDLQAGGFEAGVDLADHVLGHGVGFDDGEGAFDSHVIAPQKLDS